MKAVFTGGGTGGHIYPALAVAGNFIDKYDCQIKYIGSSEGMEKGIVEDAGIDFFGIETDGFRSKNPFVNLGVLLKLRKAVKQVKQILKEEKPDFVFATGGYVSAPVVLAAGKLGIPVFLHEQNSIPGRSNKLSSRYAKIVFTTFPGSEKYFSKKAKIISSGLPVRKEFYNLDLEYARSKYKNKEGLKTLLITGGSGGSLFINKAALNLYKIMEDGKIQIIHVTGKRDFFEINKEAQERGILNSNINIYPYLPDMYNALAVADLCISRAGASFISEMTFLGKTGIIIPFPHSANNHQLENAKSIEEKKAGFVLLEKDLVKKPELLKELVTSLIFDDIKLKELEGASKKIGIKETLEIIEENIIKEIGVKN